VQLLKNSLAFYGTWRFNTVFTRALHWSLSWDISIQPNPSQPISLRSILILPTHLRLGFPSGLFLLAFPPISYMHSSSPPFVLHTPPISSLKITYMKFSLAEKFGHDYCASLALSFWLSCFSVGSAWFIGKVWIGFIELQTTEMRALSPFYTPKSSPLHMHYGSRPSLVCWQRNNNSTIVTSDRTWSIYRLTFNSSWNESSGRLTTTYCSLGTSEFSCSKRPSFSYVKARAGPHRKLSHSIVDMLCLRIDCLTTDQRTSFYCCVRVFRQSVSNRCLAMGLYITGITDIIF
jgi:hypothetical protein